jgi:hypothetical protein
MNAVSVAYRVDQQRNVVVIDHDIPVETVTYTPDEARDLARRLNNAAELCEALGSSVVLGGDA